VVEDVYDTSDEVESPEKESPSPRCGGYLPFELVEDVVVDEGEVWRELPASRSCVSVEADNTSNSLSLVERPLHQGSLVSSCAKEPRSASGSKDSQLGMQEPIVDCSDRKTPPVSSGPASTGGSSVSTAAGVALLPLLVPAASLVIEKGDGWRELPARSCVSAEVDSMSNSPSLEERPTGQAICSPGYSAFVVEPLGNSATCGALGGGLKALDQVEYAKYVAPTGDSKDRLRLGVSRATLRGLPMLNTTRCDGPVYQHKEFGNIGYKEMVSMLQSIESVRCVGAHRFMKLCRRNGVDSALWEAVDTSDRLLLSEHGLDKALYAMFGTRKGA
jgi:hypothetical protein